MEDRLGGIGPGPHRREIRARRGPSLDAVGAPEQGGVGGYLARCFPDESEVSSRFALWAASGAQALTVYVTALNDTAEGGEVTLAGCDMLRFDEDGLCTEQRDYWNVASGRVPDGKGWPS